MKYVLYPLLFVAALTAIIMTIWGYYELVTWTDDNVGPMPLKFLVALIPPAILAGFIAALDG